MQSYRARGGLELNRRPLWALGLGDDNINIYKNADHYVDKSTLNRIPSTEKVACGETIECLYIRTEHLTPLTHPRNLVNVLSGTLSQRQNSYRVRAGRYAPYS